MRLPKRSSSSFRTRKVSLLEAPAKEALLVIPAVSCNPGTRDVLDIVGLITIGSLWSRVYGKIDSIT